MAFRRLQTIRSLYRTLEVREFSSLLGSVRSYSNVIVNGTNFRGISSGSYECNHDLPWTSRKIQSLRSTTATELYVSMGDRRSVTTQAKAPSQARQTGSFKVSMTSPGIIYEPYAPRESISFWRRWFTRSGWRRTKEDIILELKSAFAIAKLRKSGYSKQKFYKEALGFYKEINTQIATGDKTSLRKAVTENMYSGLKNEIKQRESRWSTLYWELIEPAVKIRTLRARLIAVDRNDQNKVFIQLTLEFLTKQKFEAYDSKGAVVAGDKSKEWKRLKLNDDGVVPHESDTVQTFNISDTVQTFNISMFLSEIYGFLRNLSSTLELTGVFVVGLNHSRYLLPRT